jgi:hypothetical protein
VIVDDRVREVVSDSGAVGHPVAAALRAIACGAMAGPLEPAGMLGFWLDPGVIINS